jgi:hypothetical protein
MTKRNNYPTLKNLKGKSAHIGAAALASLTLAAGSAKAETGGTVAPAPKIVMTGGVQSDSPEQNLDDIAQADVNRLSKLAAKIPKAHKNTTYTRSIQGTMGQETITVPAVTEHGSNRGQYRFDIFAPPASNGRGLQLDQVDSILVSEGVTDEKGLLTGPTTQIKIGRNPLTGSFEASGFYQTFKGGEKVMDANVIPPKPEDQVLTDLELQATFTQMQDAIKGAAHGDPVGMRLPAFDKQGHTILDPEN